MKFWTIITLCASSIFTQSALADGSAIGVAVEIKVTSEGAHTFRVFNGATITSFGQPACALSSHRFAIADEDSPAGRSQLALLLLSKAIGIGNGNITVIGTGTCTRVEDAEDVASIEKS